MQMFCIHQNFCTEEAEVSLTTAKIFYFGKNFFKPFSLLKNTFQHSYHILCAFMLHLNSYFTDRMWRGLTEWTSKESHLVVQVRSVKRGSEQVAVVQGNVQDGLYILQDTKGSSGCQPQDGHLWELALHDPQKLVIWSWTETTQLSGLPSFTKHFHTCSSRGC